MNFHSTKNSTKNVTNGNVSGKIKKYQTITHPSPDCIPNVITIFLHSLFILLKIFK